MYKILHQFFLRQRPLIPKTLLAMKLITFIMIVSIMQVSASLRAQKITLSERNASLDKVLTAIKAQTGYDFVFTGSLLKNAKPVTVTVVNEELENVLAQIFKDQPLLYSIEDNTVVVIRKEKSFMDRLKEVFVLPVDVRGTVTDSLGQPLAGATIKVKGTNMTAIANNDGSFFFPGLKEDAILEVYYIGYKTKEIAVKGVKGSVTVVLYLENKALEEVVVSTGYQKMSAEKLAGSFDVITNHRFNEQVGTGILERLESVASSLSVDRKTNKPGINIRGISTLNGQRGALVIIDNFPYEGDMGNINPNDVENITILKDAAASSIWGAKAANGVIVITTKRGRYQQPLRLSYNTNFSVTEKPNLNYLKPMSSSDFIDLEMFLFEKGQYTSMESPTSAAPLTPLVELLIAKRDGKISAADADAQIAWLRQQNNMDNYAQHFYRTGINRQYSIGLSGGEQKQWWSLSAGYDRNSSNLDAAYDRLNLSFKNGYMPVKNLELAIGGYYTRSARHSGQMEYGSIRATNGSLPPYVNFTDENGNALPVMNQYRSEYLSRFAGIDQLLDWNYYPAKEALLTPNSAKLQDLMLNLSAKYQWQGFGAQILYQYGRQTTVDEQFYEEDSYYTRNLINTLTQVSGGTVKRPIPLGTIYDYGNGQYSRHHLRGQLEYKNTFAQRHELNAFAGVELRDEFSLNDSFRRYGFDRILGSSVSVDFANIYPRFLGSGQIPITNNSNHSYGTNRYVSLYANAAYTYLNKYTLTASARRDASNLFGLNVNDQWNPFWSLGGSWHISRESFFKYKADLRLRASYGVSGNVNPNMAAVTTIVYDAVSTYTRQPMTNYKNFRNPELRWENTYMFNVGLDFSLLDHRLKGSLEYYRKRGTDLFGLAEIDATAGIGNTMTKNVATMKGNGVDLNLQWQHTKGVLNWQSDINFSLNRDEITAYYLLTNPGNLLLVGTNRITGQVGRPVYALYSYQWGGLDGQSGNPVGYVNGRQSTDYAYMTANARTPEEMVYNGRIMPAYFGAFGNAFSYKGLSLSIRFSTKLGYFFRRSTVSYTNLVGSRQGHADYALRWQNPGDEQHTDVPSFIYPVSSARNTFYEYSEATAEKGDHIRLQYVNLAYAAFKQGRYKSLQNLQLFAAGNQLGIIWSTNKQHLDPDYPNLPPRPIWSFGIRGTL